jgi:hypothetical protein
MTDPEWWRTDGPERTYAIAKIDQDFAGFDDAFKPLLDKIRRCHASGLDRAVIQSQLYVLFRDRSFRTDDLALIVSMCLCRMGLPRD